MDQICLALPVLLNKTDAARDFMRELEGERNAEYDRSERRIGIPKEAWFLASLPGGDQLIAYMESPDFNRALQIFVESRDDFDQWFKSRLADATGFDLNNMPPDTKLPELLSSYQA